MVDQLTRETANLEISSKNEDFSNVSIIPELSEEEQRLLDEEIKKRAKPLEGTIEPVDFPLHDIVKEIGLDKPVEGVDLEFYEDLKTKSAKVIYTKLKSVPDAIARKYLPDLARRFVEFERRVKRIERMLWALPREDKSLEEDRFEILTELLDKTCQGMEIWEEHYDRKIPVGHRCNLEGELIHLMDTKFDLIEKICGEFGKLKDQRDEVNNERDMLRYEIRHCDMIYTEIHEKFLKSYLEMDW